MEKKKPNRYIVAAAIIVGIPLIILVTLLAVFRWRTNYAKTEVLDYTSDDGTHKLIVYMIGEPDWPFGDTHCRFDLYEGNKRIIKYSFAVGDDGANASENNFMITQGDDCISVDVYGSEQGTMTYILYYDGTVYYDGNDGTVKIQ